MYCSVITGGVFSFISMSDLNNLRKFITTTVYVIKKIVELASKSPWLNGKASGHESKGKPKVTCRWFKAHTVHVRIEIKRMGRAGRE